MKKIFCCVLLLTAYSLSLADTVWLDVDSGSNTASFHSSLAAIENSSVSASGLTFTLSDIDGGRDRDLPEADLTDFAFNDGAGAAITLRVDGLPAGDYDVESFHYDGGGFEGVLQIEFRAVGGAPTLLVDDFAFSVAPATYQITSDGTSSYELVFREDSQSNRSRLNALKIRPAGSPVAPPLIYTDADPSNTVASGGSPSPFHTLAITTDNLWRLQTGFGFDIFGNQEIYEKDQSGGVGDAALLETTIDSLEPNREYDVYVLFLSDPAESWRVRAGLEASSLTEFLPTSPQEITTDLGLTDVPGSNSHQYIGYLGKGISDDGGRIRVFVDDGEGTGASERTWYEGVATSPVGVLPVDSQASELVEIAGDGVWTWFNDERAVWHLGKLYTGYVLSDGRYGISQYDPGTNTLNETVISTGASRQRNDHNNPSITVLADQTLLIMYAKHGTENRYYWRKSLVPEPGSLNDWGIQRSSSSSSRYTYNNTYLLSSEANRVYNFHRELGWDPTINFSDDAGDTWSGPYQLINSGGSSRRPYPKYWTNGTDRIDLIYTDGHPNEAANSIFHMFYDSADASFKKSDGEVLTTLADIIAGDPLEHDLGEIGSVVYDYSSVPWNNSAPEGPDEWIPSGRAWTWDIAYGSDGHPVCVFQVQVDNVTDDYSGNDAFRDDRIYYYYAKWNGSGWVKHLIAQGGRPIYGGGGSTSAQRDYGGGMAIDPDNTNVVYISSSHSDPSDLSFGSTGLLNHTLNTQDRFEIWRGVVSDGGATTSWSPITSNSQSDHLRPIVPANHGYPDHAIWFTGNYSSFVDFDTRVVAYFSNPIRIGLSFDLVGNQCTLSWNSIPSANYQIELGGDLGLDLTPITGISSQGLKTVHTFLLPAELSGANRAFFRVVKE